MSRGEEYKYLGTTFLVECKEHINRVAGPGSRNYIIRGLISWGEEVSFPESIDGDPVTSFISQDTASGTTPYPGVRKLCLPSRLGRFPEHNDLFPDLETLMVDPENRIFSTDGKMLFKDGGEELFLSLSAGMRDRVVTVPESALRLGPFAFADSRCEEIIFENLGLEVYESSFDRSKWLERQDPAAYAGNLLFRIKPGDRKGRHLILIREGTERIAKNACPDLGAGEFLEICIPEGMRLSQLSEALISSLKDSARRYGSDNRGILILSRVNRLGKKTDSFPVPLSLDPSGAEMLKDCWDEGGKLSTEILMHVGNRQERLDSAILISSTDPGANTDACRPFILEDQEKAAGRAVELLDEEGLSVFLGHGFFEKDILTGILPELQQRGYLRSVAEILTGLM